MTSIALMGVRIIDGNGGPPIDDGLVLVEGDRIEWVGPMRRAGNRATDADMVVDGRGRTALPGLTNCHTHFAHDEMDFVRPRRFFPQGEILGLLQAVGRARRCLEHGITTLRDCNCGSHGTIALRAAFDAGTLVGPRLVLSGKAICATGGHMHVVSREADGADEVREAVREQLKAGADFVKLVAEAASGGSGGFDRPALQLTAREMAAGVRAAHKLGKRVTAHAVSRFGIAEALAAGVDCIEHGYDLTDEQIDQMARNGTWLVPTLSVHAAVIRRGPELGWPATRMAGSNRILDKGLDTVRRAHRAGVRIAAGSDGGSPANPIWDLATELEMLERAGLPRAAVIRAATRSAAELVGVEGARGTLEAGKDADLILVDGDPLADLDALRKVLLVVKAGRVVVDRLKRPRSATMSAVGAIA